MDHDDDSSQDMAQMMGFSAFGAQDHPHKKRKYNPNADSFASGAGAGPQPPPQATTSANSVPLGVPAAARPAANADEIDLADDDDGDDGQPPVKKEQSAVPGVGAASGPSSLPRRPAVDANQPAPSDAALPGRGAGGPRHHGRGADRSDRGGKPWYEDYYDNISNENPWDRLEKAMGLQPIGGAWR